MTGMPLSAASFPRHHHPPTPMDHWLSRVPECYFRLECSSLSPATLAGASLSHQSGTFTHLVTFNCMPESRQDLLLGLPLLLQHTK